MKDCLLPFKVDNYLASCNMVQLIDPVSIHSTTSTVEVPSPFLSTFKLNCKAIILIKVHLVVNLDSGLLSFLRQSQRFPGQYLYLHTCRE